MSDTLNLVVIDDLGPEQGQVTNNQMTDDYTPTVRVSLTTGSGAAIAAATQSNSATSARRSARLPSRPGIYRAGMSTSRRA